MGSCLKQWEGKDCCLLHIITATFSRRWHTKATNKIFKSNSPTLQTFSRTLLDKISDSEVFNPFLTLKKTGFWVQHYHCVCDHSPFQTSESAAFHKTRYQQKITTLLYQVFHNATILLQFSQCIFERRWCSWCRIHKTPSHFVWGGWVMITIPAYLT